MEMTTEERREQLVALLRDNDCEVTFTKVNGEQRVMPCTLKTGVVPEILGEGRKKANPNTISVWALDKQEWRSFRVDNVTDIKILSTD